MRGTRTQISATAFSGVPALDLVGQVVAAGIQEADVGAIRRASPKAKFMLVQADQQGEIRDITRFATPRQWGGVDAIRMACIQSEQTPSVHAPDRHCSEASHDDPPESADPSVEIRRPHPGTSFPRLPGEVASTTPAPRPRVTRAAAAQDPASPSRQDHCARTGRARWAAAARGIGPWLALPLALGEIGEDDVVQALVGDEDAWERLPGTGVVWVRLCAGACAPVRWRGRWGGDLARLAAGCRGPAILAWLPCLTT
jgi:hypothetical protein